MTYSEKLRWQKKRLKIMERDSFTCRLCDSKTETLNVHHKEYLRGRDPWDYEERLLITLCEGCHARVEDAKSHFAHLIVEPFFLDTFGLMVSVGTEQKVSLQRLLSTASAFPDAVKAMVTAFDSVSEEGWQCCYRLHADAWEKRQAKKQKKLERPT